LVAVQELAAAALTRQHQYAQAVRLYNQFVNTIDDATQRAQIQKLLDSTNQKWQLEMANAARQPLVGDGITQNRIVKPKLKVLPKDWIAAAADTEEGEDH
jgi:hypothetical protein